MNQHLETIIIGIIVISVFITSIIMIYYAFTYPSDTVLLSLLDFKITPGTLGYFSVTPLVISTMIIIMGISYIIKK